MYNGIPNQSKQRKDTITPQEWNSVVNKLKLQGNNTTEQLSVLHRFLVGGGEEVIALPHESEHVLDYIGKVELRMNDSIATIENTADDSVERVNTAIGNLDSKTTSAINNLNLKTTSTINRLDTKVEETITRVEESNPFYIRVKEPTDKQFGTLWYEIV